MRTCERRPAYIFMNSSAYIWANSYAAAAELYIGRVDSYAVTSTWRPSVNYIIILLCTALQCMTYSVKQSKQFNLFEKNKLASKRMRIYKRQLAYIWADSYAATFSWRPSVNYMSILFAQPYGIWYFEYSKQNSSTHSKNIYILASRRMRICKGQQACI